MKHRDHRGCLEGRKHACFWPSGRSFEPRPAAQIRSRVIGDRAFIRVFWFRAGLGASAEIDLRLFGKNVASAACRTKRAPG